MCSRMFRFTSARRTHSCIIEPSNSAVTAIEIAPLTKSATSPGRWRAADEKAFPVLPSNAL